MEAFFKNKVLHIWKKCGASIKYQWNPITRSEIYACVYDQLIFEKVAKITLWRKKSLYTVLRKLDNHMQRMKQDPCYSLDVCVPKIHMLKSSHSMW